MTATNWAALWAFIGLLIFLGLMVYVKAHGMLARSLDERADRIRDELKEARKLREEAQQILLEYQKKRQDAEAEAADIVAAAKREAELLIEDSKQRSEDYVARRTVAAEHKIAQAERDAINEVRSRAVDIAIEAARRTIIDKASPELSSRLFETSLQAVKSKMN